MRQLFGEAVPGGSLDNAAHLVVMADDIPTGVVTVLVEVKNIREWLYPNSSEIFQLLTKAALLQRAHPDRRFVPVLVCRRAHKTLFRMAKAFGFYVIDSGRQYITPSADVSDEQLTEVRHGLGFADLVNDTDPDPLIVKHLAASLPKQAAPFTELWSVAGPALADHFSSLRNPSMSPGERAQALDELRAAAAEALPRSSGW